MLVPVKDILSGALERIRVRESVPALLPRSRPLAVEQMDSLSKLVDEQFSFLPKQKILYGGSNGAEFETLGFGIIQNNKLSEREKSALAQEISRPATREFIIYHLTRLGSHLHDTRGAEMFAAMIQDVSFDLAGLSEYAIVKVCRSFRLDTGRTFYPKSNEIIDACRAENDKVNEMVCLCSSEIA